MTRAMGSLILNVGSDFLAGAVRRLEECSR